MSFIGTSHNRIPFPSDNHLHFLDRLPDFFDLHHSSLPRLESRRVDDSLVPLDWTEGTWCQKSTHLPLFLQRENFDNKFNLIS